MLNTNITNFRKNLFEMFQQTITFNEPISINTKDGNAVLISEDDYNGLMETLYLTSIPNMEKKLIDGKNTPLSECIDGDTVEW